MSIRHSYADLYPRQQPAFRPITDADRRAAQTRAGQQQVPALVRAAFRELFAYLDQDERVELLQDADKRSGFTRILRTRTDLPGELQTLLRRALPFLPA